MDTKPYTLIVVFQAKAGKEQALQALLASLVPPSLLDEGCMQYQLHRSTSRVGQFMFFETWVSKEAHAKHCQTPHIQEFRIKREGLLDQTSQVSHWEILEPINAV